MDGGSVYRVFKGVILCRQTILAVNTVGEGVTARCEVSLSDDVVRVAPTPRRAFQGWRYLEEDDAPPDLADQRAALRAAKAEADLPAKMVAELKSLGLL